MSRTETLKGRGTRMKEAGESLVGWARIQQVVRETGKGAVIDHDAILFSLSAIESAKADPDYECACETVEANRIMELYNNLNTTEQLAVLDGKKRVHIDYMGNVIAQPIAEKK